MRRGQDTRSRILEAAERQFAAEGYAGAHLQEIAEQVGVRKTALYYYFESKAALYVAVLGEMLASFDGVLEGALTGADPPKERLDRLVGSFNQHLAEHRWDARLLIRIFVDDPGIDLAPVMPIVERAIGRLFRFYREGVDAGAFRRLSSRHFFQTLLGMATFHYAAPIFSGDVIGVEDVFSADAVEWRRAELLALLEDGVLRREGKPEPKRGRPTADRETASGGPHLRGLAARRQEESG